MTRFARSRARLVAWLVVLSLAVGLLACRKSAPAATGRSQAAAAEPKRGGTLVFGFDGASYTQFILDPHKSGFPGHHRVLRSIYDSLVGLSAKHEITPWLAKSWQISPDGKHYTFQLRQDVRFHDGTRFDAAAVKFNLDRVADRDFVSTSITDLGSYAASEVLDEFTIRVDLASPYAPLLAHLSKSSLAMVSPTAVAKWGTAFTSHPVGTGPFRYVSQRPGVEVITERNGDYRWPSASAKHQGPPWLDRLIFRSVSEEATRMAIIQSGEAQLVDMIPAQNLLALRRDPAYQVVQGELLNQNYALHLNVRRPPWDQLEARQAFRAALDLDAALKTTHLGTQKRTDASLSPSIPGYDPTLEGVARTDLAGAKASLDALGWKPGADGIRVKDGKRLSMVFLDVQGNREKRLDLLTVLRGQLRQAGIDLHIESMPGGTFVARQNQGDFDLGAGSLFGPDPDILRRVYTPGYSQASPGARIADPELNQVLQAASEEGELDKRIPLYHQAQRILVERVYAIPIYVLSYTLAAKHDVHGVALDQHGFPVFHDAWLTPL